MSFEKIKDTVSNFLDILDQQQLIKFNSESWNNRFTKSYSKQSPIFADTFHKILEHSDEIKKIIRVSDEALSIFVITIMVNFITSNLEYIKKCLSVLIDREKIIFNETVTYGYLLKLLCDYLKFEDSQRKLIYDSFFVRFRNATSHIKYAITKNGVTIKNAYDSSIHYNLEQLNQLMNEVSGILNIFDSFAAKKTVELEKKAIELEKNAMALNKKTKELEKEIIARRLKNKAIKRETARINRKTEKLKRKKELTDRKVKKLQNRTARIVSKS